MHCNPFHVCIDVASLLLNTQYVVSVCTDTQLDAAWRLEVSESLKALVNQPSKAMVPQDFSRVGSTQANGILASLEIVECLGNVLDPVVVSDSAPALTVLISHSMSMRTLELWIS